MVGHGQHLAHRRPVAGRHQLDRVLGKSGGTEPLDQAGMDRGRGMKAFRPAAQDHRIARFQAQRAGIGCDVGAAFIDHPHHAQGRAHPPDMQAARHVPFGDHLAHRIGLAGHRAQPVHDALDPPLIQHQPVHHRRAQPLVPAVSHVLFVRRDDLGAPAPHSVGGRQKGLFPGFGACECKVLSRRPGAAADVLHQGGDVVEIFHVGRLSCSAAPGRKGGVWVFLTRKKQQVRVPYRPGGSRPLGRGSPGFPRSPSIFVRGSRRPRQRCSG